MKFVKREVVGGRTLTVEPTTITTGDLRRERDQAAAAHRQIDILDRLKATRSGLYHHLDTADAVAEIEWLRASKPADAVTRQELVEVVQSLLEMRTTIDALLARIQKGESTS